MDGATPPDLAAVSARWARVSDAIRVTVRARIKPVQIARGLVAAFASTATITGGQGARGAA